MQLVVVAQALDFTGATQRAPALVLPSKQVRLGQGDGPDAGARAQHAMVKVAELLPVHHPEGVHKLLPEGLGVLRGVRCVDFPDAAIRCQVADAHAVPQAPQVGGGRLAVHEDHQLLPHNCVTA